jgi:hypothetical protein
VTDYHIDIAEQLHADGYITPAERDKCSGFYDPAYPVTVCPNGDVVIHRDEPIVLKGYADPIEAPEPPAIVSTIHFHYDKLTDAERSAVDEAYAELTEALKEHGLGIRGDDTAERVVDAIACGLLNSRGLIQRAVKPNNFFSSSLTS